MHLHMSVCISAHDDQCGPSVKAAVTHPVFGEEVRCEGPGRIAHHLVHVAAVCDSIISLLLVHHGKALEFVCEVVTAHCTHTVTSHHGHISITHILKSIIFLFKMSGYLQR